MEVGKLEVKIDVDSTDVSAATLALDKLTDAAVRAADALDRLRGHSSEDDWERAVMVNNSRKNCSSRPASEWLSDVDRDDLSYVDDLILKNRMGYAVKAEEEK